VLFKPGSPHWLLPFCNVRCIVAKEEKPHGQECPPAHRKAKRCAKPGAGWSSRTTNSGWSCGPVRSTTPSNKGRGLFPLLVSLRQWGEDYFFDPDETHVRLMDRECGKPVRKLELRSQDGRLLGPSDTIVKAIPSRRGRLHSWPSPPSQRARMSARYVARRSVITATLLAGGAVASWRVAQRITWCAPYAPPSWRPSIFGR
jgi:hypothetical protein